jgi:type II secretory pathway pseudopilin PulG
MRHRSRQAGWSLLELLVAATLGILVLGAVLPAAAYLRDVGRAQAAARHIVQTLQAVRWESVSRGTYRGLLFEPDEEGVWTWRRVEDGNGNGLRTAEIRSGVDRTLSAPRRIEADAPGARLGFPPLERIPEIPPRAGSLDPDADPVQFGRSHLVSFSPLGRSSSGTLYLTDGRRALYAVVVYGPTGRVRVWSYDAAAGRWRL